MTRAASRFFLAVASLVGCAHPGVDYRGGSAWSDGWARHCAHCGGGETVEIVVERTAPGGVERLVVEFETCVERSYDTEARIVHVRHVEGGDDAIVADERDVPIDVVTCSREGPIHVRFRGRLAGEPIRFDVAVTHPVTSEGFE